MFPVCRIGFDEGLRLSEDGGALSVPARPSMKMFASRLLGRVESGTDTRPARTVKAHQGGRRRGGLSVVRRRRLLCHRVRMPKRFFEAGRVPGRVRIA